MSEFRLPHEILEGAGVPNAYRADVAYKVLAGKYCALVEAVMKETGGKPVRVSLRRAQQIIDQDDRTDPRLTVIVLELPVGDNVHVDVSLASPEEVAAANKRNRLHRMGTRRN